MTKKLIISVLLCSLLMTTTVFAKTEPTYNTPNTSTEDSDKKSECEVTADIHYAYYVSMPAALTLEPYEEEGVKSEFCKYFYHSEWFTGYVESINKALNADFFRKMCICVIIK